MRRGTPASNSPGSQTFFTPLRGTLRECGLVGELPAAQVLYLAVNSRVSRRPLSVIVKGASAGGKSFVVDRTLRFFPSDAFFTLTSMSEKALIYSQEPLKHRFVVLFEEAGMSGEQASYLIRTLLSEGELRYWTVQRINEHLETVAIHREGPTGLIVTTTRVAIHPENETRALPITIDDSPQQTREVLRAIARGQERPVDLARWHALQTWLALSPGEVRIPYARALAETIPSVATRMRRDFAKVLTLIESHAFLHQATRERDGRGRIVATLEDYERVRALVAPLFAEAVEATVPATVRETVEAVEAITYRIGPNGHSYGTCTIAKVAERLQLHKSTVGRRVQRAIELGYLQNTARPHAPAKIRRLGALPDDDSEVLPSVEDLSAEVARLRRERRGRGPSRAGSGA